MQVILNFDWHYQFSRSFLDLKWFTLMRLIRTWHLISRHWVSIWYTECLKKYPLMTGNRKDKIRYHYSPSKQLNLSIFNLDPHTLHLKIGHQTLAIQTCKVKIYSAPKTRGFVKGPSHDLLSQACCTGISTLTFSFLHRKELYLEMLQLFYKQLFRWGINPCIAFHSKC